VKIKFKGSQQYKAYTDRTVQADPALYWWQRLLMFGSNRERLMFFLFFHYLSYFGMFFINGYFHAYQFHI
jgi:hypothetical protein